MYSNIKKEQPILFQTISNSKKVGKFPHSILLNGTSNLNLLQLAKYVALNIVCEQINPCINCNYCKQIINLTFPDLIVLDGEIKSIRKEQVLDLQKRFSKSSIDALGVKIYIINNIENATQAAINSLLKFLEEPDHSVYAILTTANIKSVLPTIISRSLNIRLLNVDLFSTLSEQLKEDVSLDDLFIISNIVSSKAEILNLYADENYLKIKNLAFEILSKLIKQERLFFFVNKGVNDTILKKLDFDLLLDILIILIKEANRNKLIQKENILFDALFLKEIQNCKLNLSQVMEVIINIKSKLRFNANLKLVLNEFFIRLEELTYGQ